MTDVYPTMQPAQPERLTTGEACRPLWQVLARKAPDMTAKRVLVLHAGAGWFCRMAINRGAIAVLGVDDDRQAISDARAMASSDRLRFRMLPMTKLDLLTGPYDLIVGAFDQRQDDLSTITHALAACLRGTGQMLLAVTNGQQAPAKRLTSRLSVTRVDAITDPEVNLGEQLHLLLARRAKA